MQKQSGKKRTLIVLVTSNILMGAFVTAMITHHYWHQPKKVTTTTSKMKTIKATDQKGFLQEALMGVDDEMEGCYNEYLRREPVVTEGSVSVQWLVNAMGEAQDLRVADSELKDDELSTCILNNLKDIQFSPPPSAEPVQVAHKFRFRVRAPASIEFR